MTPGRGFVRISWDGASGSLHFESNLTHLEAVAVVRLVEHTLLKQMAAGAGVGVLAEGRLTQPALVARRVDDRG